MTTSEYSFGNWVRRQRKALDLTQPELAARVGCSVSAIFKIESDERRPSRQIAELLAKHLEMPVEQLDLFIKVARQEKTVDHLPPLSTPQPVPGSNPVKANLPIPLTSLIGREHEVRMVIQQIQDPSCRLLTLTGPGGVGKTRLALEVAHRLHDGLELLDELLEHAPQVKLLTTSREQLNLRAEWAFEVQGLPVPSHIEMENLESNSAAALFVQRAKQTKMDFIPTRDDYSSIKRICQLVEGLPLALELAATWVRMLSAKEIAHEIERNIDFLTTIGRDVPQRHRSIRAVFEYSWNLLTEEERRILRQLAVFRGGFTREAAEGVASAVLSQLSALVDKSLLRHTNAPTGRYDFHELIRQ